MGGGPKTSIFLLGKLGSISDHFLLGLSTKLPPSLFPSGTCLANAKNICLLVKFKSLAFFELAITIPSYPTFISTTSIPFSLHLLNSFFLILLEALVISG